MCEPLQNSLPQHQNRTMASIFAANVWATKFALSYNCANTVSLFLINLVHTAPIDPPLSFRFSFGTIFQFANDQKLLHRKPLVKGREIHYIYTTGVQHKRTKLLLILNKGKTLIFRARKIEKKLCRIYTICKVNTQIKVN